jgi:hypothetical protein
MKRAIPSILKAVLVIGYWNLNIICDLVLGAWDFSSTVAAAPMFAPRKQSGDRKRLMTPNQIS